MAGVREEKQGTGVANVRQQTENRNRNNNRGAIRTRVKPGGQRRFGSPMEVNLQKHGEHGQPDEGTLVQPRYTID